MSHARETIRGAITTALTGLTTTGTNVFTNHVYPFATASLPNVSLYVAHEPETVQDDGEMGSFDLRVLPFLVTGRAKVSNSLDDVLDDIAAEVETAIHGSTALAGYVKDVRLVGTEVALDPEGEMEVGAINMEWIAVYRVDRTAPTVPVQ